MIRKLAVVKNFILRHHMRLLTRGGESEAAQNSLNEIVTIVAADDNVRRCLERHGATAAVLHELYDFLEQGGADRWIHGNYVAALSITHPLVIEAYLEQRHRRGDRRFRLSFADTCVRYIEGGYTDQFLRQNLGLSANAMAATPAATGIAGFEGAA